MAVDHTRAALLYRVALTALVITFVARAHADAPVDKALGVGIEEVIKEAMKRKMDEVSTRAAASGSGMPSALGAKTSAGIGVLTSARDFFKAKDDKGRTYAAAGTAASGLMFVNPLAGTAAQLGLMVIQLVEAAMSVEHFERMEKIREETNIYVSDLNVARKKILLGEIALFASVLDQLNAAQGGLLELKPHLDECQNAAVFTDAGVAKSCLETLVRTSEKIRWIASSNRLLAETRLDELDRNRFFEKFKLEGSVLLAQALNFEKVSADSDAQIRVFIVQVAEQVAVATHDVTWSNEHANAKLIDTYADHCILVEENFIRSSVVLQLRSRAYTLEVANASLANEYADLNTVGNVIDDDACSSSVLGLEGKRASEMDEINGLFARARVFVALKATEEAAR